MITDFPKLPGYIPTHDPTATDHKKVSHVKLERIRNAKNEEVPLYHLPKNIQKNFLPEKNDESKSVSHTQFPNHMNEGRDINELFEPNYVKLDKQVLRFFGYFKESVVESNLENFRIRKLILYYFFEDRSIMIVEPKVSNSGCPQGQFLKRQVVKKEDGSKMPF